MLCIIRCKIFKFRFTIISAKSALVEGEFVSISFIDGRFEKTIIRKVFQKEQL